MKQLSQGPRKRPKRKAGVAKSLSHKAEFREFIAELFAASAGMQFLRRAIGRSAGLGSTELAILLALWRLGPRNSIGIRGLAEHLHVAGPHITDEVGELVHRRYLRKLADASDMRAVRLQLTEKALRLLESLAPTLDRVNTHLFEGMTDRDVRVLRASFRRLIGRSVTAVEVLHSWRGKRQ